MAQSACAALTESEAAHVEFIKMAKVAVATALIRSKPDNLTGEQYAAFLHQKIQSDRDKFEGKCKDLEKELLDLKIQVLRKGNAESEVPACDAQVPSCLSTTPPSSSEKIANTQSTKMQSHRNETLSSHMKFLESVSNIKFNSKLLERATESELMGLTSDIASDILQGRIVNEQTLKSVEVVLAFVKEATLSKRLTITRDVLFHSVSCLVHLLVTFEQYLLSPSSEDDRKAMEVTTSIVEKCCDTSMELQASIMSATKINAFKTQKLCCEVIFHFAQCPSLCPTIVRQLIQGISAVSVHLKSTAKSSSDGNDDGSPPDYILCENACYLFKTLEAILKYLLTCLNQARVETTVILPNQPDTQAMELDAQEFVTPDSQPLAAPDSLQITGRNENENMVSDSSKLPKLSKKSQTRTKKSKKKKQTVTGNIMEFFNAVKNSQTPNSSDGVSQPEKCNEKMQTLAPSFEKVTAVPMETETTTPSVKEGHQTRENSGYSDFDGIISVITPDFLSSLQDAMENALICTSDDFPLFSFYVWKISCITEEIMATL